MTINVSDMSTKEGYDLDKESLVDAVGSARLEGLVAPVPAFLDGELKFLSEIYRDGDDKVTTLKCNCGRPGCKDGRNCASGEYPMWSGDVFCGIVTTSSGERKMLHNPRELLLDDVTREVEGIPSVTTGHLMTKAEFWSAVHHRPDGGFSPGMKILETANAFDANRYLANFRGRENAEEETLYQKAVVDICVLVGEIMASFPGSNDYGVATLQLISILRSKYILGKWDSDDEVLGFVSFVTGGSNRPASPRMVQEFEMEKVRQRMNGKCKVQYTARSGTFCSTPHEAVEAVDELMERLVNEKRALVSEESDMYPFHDSLEEPYTDVPGQRIRAKDIVEVTIVKCLEFPSFVAHAGTDVQVYVISVTSWGKVTGLVQTNKGKHFWLHFDANRTKRMVAKGCNWD